jgi:hypothetical protein
MPVRDVTWSHRAKRHPRYRRGRLALWLSVALVGCLAILLAVSYLLDPTVVRNVIDGHFANHDDQR